MSTGALRQLGSSARRLLRTLLASAQGASVETLCGTLGISHNAVRQHLSALIGAGFVARGAVRPSGGRPQMRFVITEAGRELFPRNYALIASGMLEQLYANAGKSAVQTLLAEMGTRLGSAAAERVAATDEPVVALAEQLDALGYEAQAVARDGELQIEAYNCVFHALAKAHPEVCRFDLSFMQAASGREVQHLECLVRGGSACRFRLAGRVAGDEPTR
jgi:predicted ArsR family transcriptional regulator